MNALITIHSVNPLVVEVPVSAGIRVRGEKSWVWDPDDEGRRYTGGSYGAEHIADALVRAYPPEDPRWHKPFPEPFWPRVEDDA